MRSSSNRRARAGRIAKFFLPLLACVLIYPHVAAAAAAAESSQERPEMTGEGQFNYAGFLGERGDYTRAAREFARVIEEFPASPLVPEAQFRMAEAYMDAGLYKEAADQFRQFLKNFKASPLADEAGLKLLRAEKAHEEELKERASASPPSPTPSAPSAPPELPVVKLEPRPGMRAVQVMMFEGKSYSELDGELERLRRAGVDTVIVRVFSNPGDRIYRFARPASKVGVYFNTTHAPVVDDILGRVLSIAHKKDLKVFAWMTTRYADYGLESRKDLACKGYDLAERRVVRCKGLDLFNDEAVRHLEGLYRDL
ncbi:MAG: tetratricopeptide repeat protein, partial [Thermodesulfobacteriota bacterium]